MLPYITLLKKVNAVAVEVFMPKLTFKDILNSAIAEFYGENSVKLLMLFTNLNLKGQLVIIDHAELCSNIPEEYSRTINLGEQSAKAQEGV